MHFLIFLDSRAVQPPFRKETSECRPRPLSLVTLFRWPYGRVMILHALRKLVLFCPDDWGVANREPGRGFVREGVLSSQTPEWRPSSSKRRWSKTLQVVYGRAEAPNPCDGLLSLPL